MSAVHYCRICGELEMDDKPHNHDPKKTAQISPSAEDIRKDGYTTSWCNTCAEKTTCPRPIRQHGVGADKCFQSKPREQASEKDAVCKKCGSEMMLTCAADVKEMHRMIGEKDLLIDKQAEHHALFKNEVALKMTEQAGQLKAKDEALCNYGRHSWNCQLKNPEPCSKCTCGFEQALKGGE